MAHVVAEPCVKCKYTDCVEVCPVDCFLVGKNSLAIDPDECIDCGVCVKECPVNAIWEESELPAKWQAYKDINALVADPKRASTLDMSSWPAEVKAQVGAVTRWPNITKKGSPMPGADEAAKESGKLKELSLEPGSE